jgi:hypothetical protein
MFEPRPAETFAFLVWNDKNKNHCLLSKNHDLDWVLRLRGEELYIDDMHIPYGLSFVSGFISYKHPKKILGCDENTFNLSYSHRRLKPIETLKLSRNTLTIQDLEEGDILEFPIRPTL